MDDILTKLAVVWNDPVWSKIIAAGVLALIGVIGTFFNWWRAGFKRLMSLLGRIYRLEPNIKLVNVAISTPSPSDPPRQYPLKCYVTLQNSSSECAEIHLSDYKPETALAAVKAFPLEVLQLRFGQRWWPNPDGVDRIAVLPRQMCRAWIGLDEQKLNEAQANRLLLLGQLGTLVVSVNGKPVSILLKS
jgi:hypothetical protein